MECIAGRSKGSVVEWQCHECPYDAPILESGCDEWAMIADALALLKEQEPRVMTLEEAENRIGDCIYIEIREKNIGEYRMIGELDSYSRKYKYLYVMHPGETHCHPYSYNLLNKIWRIWSAKPTEQQMRDTPWEGEKDA